MIVVGSIEPDPVRSVKEDVPPVSTEAAVAGVHEARYVLGWDPHDRLIDYLETLFAERQAA